jgi:hypothetical protein
MRKPGIAIVAKLLNESVRAINHRAKLLDGRCGDFIAGRIELTTTEKNALLKALAPLPAELLFGNEDEIRAIFAALPEDARNEAVRRVIRGNDAVVDVAKAR